MAVDPRPEHGIYVYAFVRDGMPSPVTDGVGGAAVRLVPAGDLAAAVSDAPAGLRARRRDLMAHQNVLGELAAAGPVLPMRFGVIAADEPAVHEGLMTRHDECVEQLSALEGRTEMNVKGSVVPDSFDDLVRSDTRLRALALKARRSPDYQTKVELGEAIAAGVRRRAERAAEDVLVRLGALAERTAGADLAGDTVLNMSYLIPADAVPEFSAAVTEAARRHQGHLALSLTGPLPCYSFVTDAAVPARA
ncbi:GvpL/GvpF family gas vesicle protein [Streptomyces sp. NBC_00306]|uniref:GvpL/GvpF family gas vesicle protein n=1 Tax=Streptomyces sp. NBC_00306 TaxID=2975708 RepID=UPI002E2BF83A|nr:GvpL/GvpF family gas vesicle protein [Streptomyces sp. NBC_00306]